MGLFTTRQLLGYTEQKVKFRALFLELFFRRTVTFHTQEVMLDKITGKTPVAAYVSPVVSGKVLRSRGGETRVLRPAMLNQTPAGLSAGGGASSGGRSGPS
ncbi:major head protein [Escherichia coli]|nr:major head protein [Escherichia coli]